MRMLEVARGVWSCFLSKCVECMKSLFLDAKEFYRLCCGFK